MEKYNQIRNDADTVYKSIDLLNNIKEILASNTDGKDKYNYTVFHRQLLMLVALQYRDYDGFISNFDGGGNIINDISAYLQFFIKQKLQRNRSSALFSRKLIGFMSGMFLFEDFVNGMKSPRIEIPNKVYDPKYVKELLEYITLHGSTITKFIEDYRNYYNLINQYNKELDNKKKSIDSNVDELNNVIQNKIEKQLSEFKKDMNEKIQTIDDEYKGQFKKNTDAFNDKCKKLVNDIDKQCKELVDNIAIAKSDIYQSLHDIEGNVFREQLAYYFYNERKKLKGDLDINMFYYALIICFVFWCVVLPRPFVLDEVLVVKLMGSFLVSLGIVQLVSNCKLKKSKAQVVLNKENATSEENHDNGKLNRVDKNWLFQEQISELLTPYWCWLIATFSGMVGIGVVAYKVFDELKGQSGLTYSVFLPYTAGYMILIWFTWFCSKQFSYVKQICDEYEYKYALSKSYLSYREEARKLAEEGHDVAIMIVLLDSVIKNIAQSPVQSVQRDCHTPFSEVFNSVKDVAKMGTNDKGKQP